MAFKQGDQLDASFMNPRGGDDRSTFKHLTLLTPGYFSVAGVHALTWVLSIVLGALFHLGTVFNDNLTNHHATLAGVNAGFQGLIVVMVLLHSSLNRNISVFDVVGNVLVIGTVLTQMAMAVILFGITYGSNNEFTDCLLAIIILFVNMLASGMVICFYVAFAIDAPGKPPYAKYTPTPAKDSAGV